MAESWWNNEKTTLGPVGLGRFLVKNSPAAYLCP